MVDAEAVKAKVKYYCMTVEGLTRLKWLVGVTTGVLVVTASVLGVIVSLLNPFRLCGTSGTASSAC